MNDTERPIHAVFEAYRAAVAARDVDGFCKLYRQDARVFDAWETWSYEGRDAWRKVIEYWFGSLGDETVAVSVEHVQVTAGAGFAIASAGLTYAAISPAGELLRSMQNRLSWGLVKENDGWLIVHEHTSMPVAHEGMRAITSRPA